MTQNLLKQDYAAPRLKSSLQQFYDSHRKLVDRYEISILSISNDNGSFTSYVDVFFPLPLPRLLPDLTVYRYMSNTAGILQEAGTTYPSQAHEMTLDFFGWVRLAQPFTFLCCPIACLCVVMSVTISA